MIGALLKGAKMVGKMAKKLSKAANNGGKKSEAEKAGTIKGVILALVIIITLLTFIVAVIQVFFNFLSTFLFGGWFSENEEEDYNVVAHSVTYREIVDLSDKMKDTRDDGLRTVIRGRDYKMVYPGGVFVDEYGDGTSPMIDASTPYIEQVKKIIAEVESSGKYDSVNGVDIGGKVNAMTIGKYQMTGSNARDALYTIKLEDPDFFEKHIPSNTALGREIETKTSWGYWSSRPLEEYEIPDVKIVLGSKAGIAGQEKHMNGFLNNHIKRAMKLGVTEPKTLAFISDIKHQFKPETANNFIDSLGAHKNNLDFAYKKAMETPIIQDYQHRRKTVYEMAKSVGVGVDEEEIESGENGGKEESVTEATTITGRKMAEGAIDMWEKYGTVNNDLNPVTYFLGGGRDNYRPKLDVLINTREADASSFTSIVAEEYADMKIGWTAADQAKKGKVVLDENDLQPGDLVIFESKNEYQGHQWKDPLGEEHFVNHIGIYIGGKKYIDLSKSSNTIAMKKTTGDVFVDDFLAGIRLGKTGYIGDPRKLKEGEKPIDEAQLHLISMLQTDYFPLEGNHFKIQKSADSIEDIKVDKLDGEWKDRNIGKTWTIAKGLMSKVSKDPRELIRSARSKDSITPFEEYKEWEIVDWLMEARFRIAFCYLVGDNEGAELFFWVDNDPCKDLNEHFDDFYIPGYHQGVLFQTHDRDITSWKCFAEKRTWVEVLVYENKDGNKIDGSLYEQLPIEEKTKYTPKRITVEEWNKEEIPIPPLEIKEHKIINGNNIDIKEKPHLKFAEESRKKGKIKLVILTYKEPGEDGSQPCQLPNETNYRNATTKMVESHPTATTFGGLFNEYDTVSETSGVLYEFSRYSTIEYGATIDEADVKLNNTYKGLIAYYLAREFEGTGIGYNRDILELGYNGFAFPIHPDEFNWEVTSDYGCRWLKNGTSKPKDMEKCNGKYEFGKQTNDFHDGTDMSGVNTKTPIRASKDGVVYMSGYDGRKWSYGNYVYIDHTPGVNPKEEEKVYTIYAHMSDRKVAEGDPVKQGQIIGYLGGTPNYSPHLHFEFCGEFISGGCEDRQDPAPYITFPPKNKKILSWDGYDEYLKEINGENEMTQESVEESVEE